MAHSDIQPAPPALDGIIWRAIGRDDLPALVRLAETCRATDGGIAFMNRPDYLERRYLGQGLFAATGAFDAEERLVAGAAVHLSGEADAMRAQIAGQVRPDQRGRGLGSYLMRWSQWQAGRMLTAAGAPDGRMQIVTESLTDAADRLYQAHAFAPVDGYLIMGCDLRRPLPNRPLLPGVTLATWQPDLAQQFYQAYHASFRSRPGFPGWSAAEWIAWTADDNFVPEWSLLALAGDRPLAFITAGIEHGGPCIFQVGVIPEHRRRGLASTLLVETMRRKQLAGRTSTELTVNFLNNPGMIRTCERVGFETTGRRARYERTV